MTLTEPYITNTAGWQAVKQAKAIYRAGAVQEASFDGKILKGVVMAGGRRMASGLKFNSATDVENLCSCRESRQFGQICAHSVAVALHVIHAPAEEAAAKAQSPAKRETNAEGRGGAKLGGVQVTFDHRFADLWKRGRIPVKFAASESGTDISAWLSAVGIEKLPAHGVLNPEQASQLLVLLTGSEEIYLGEELLQTTSSVAGRLRVRLTRKGESFRLRPQPIVQKDQLILSAGEGGWVFYPERPMIQRLRSAPQGLEREYQQMFEEALKERPGEVEIRAERFFAVLDSWEDCLEIQSESGSFLLQSVSPSFEARFEGSLNALSGSVTVRYPGLQFRLGQEPQRGSFPIHDEEGDRYLARNPQAEQRAQDLLEEMEFSGPDADGQIHLRGEPTILRFFATYLPKLQQTWDVVLGERFQHVTRDVQVVRPNWSPVPAGSGGGDPNWLTFALDYSSPEGVEISPNEIRRLLNTGQTKHKLPNGKTVAVDLDACAEADEVLYDVQPWQEGGQYRVSRSQAGYLAMALGGKELEDDQPVSLQPLAELEQLLRDYQAQGIRWMTARLRGAAHACLLADEMGLGKTLQSLATAELLLQETDQEKPQVLIVCPSSLLSNWEHEANRFLPDRRVHILHGSKRWNQAKAIAKADFLITSYALMVRDEEQLKERDFAAVILDEASYIKNPDTKNAKSARALNSNHRIALTGTPVENSVRELWSIFEFLVPGYLGSRGEFKERYENPVASGAAPRPVLQRLRKRTQPLMLRRLKETVAKDLPPKIEQVRYCTLQPKQAALYEAILRESRSKIDEALSAKADGQARMTILTALLRLRQVCCDPRLLKLEEDKNPGSGKLDLFEELLEEVIAGEHKLLVFSQFTSMLQLMRARLEEEGINFCYLDGSSQDRAQQVERFQASGPEIPLFLISLKAGGYGLNLTAADSVVHYDPWWNPAVEAQATDRAHRIGQTRSVNVYKLITTGTVEERILALQRRKRSVIDAAMDEGEPLMRGLSTDELRDVIG